MIKGSNSKIKESDFKEMGIREKYSQCIIEERWGHGGNES